MAQMQRLHIPGASLAIIRDGRTIKEQGCLAGSPTAITAIASSSTAEGRRVFQQSSIDSWMTN
ncbi:MAG TPA: hypothetical protein VFA61_08990 [Candidatus Udaeobacter sp.]|nr:hypothetical protein [Candidatus Udaeobacter sp.]